MNRFNEYRETTNSLIYNRLRKEKFASCSHCPWHPRKFKNHNENGTWESFGFFSVDVPAGRFKAQKKAGEGRYPNWKLVSKNKKQWMKKPFILKQKWEVNEEAFDTYISIEWPLKIRSK